MKKAFAVLILFMLSVSLCACGGDVSNVETRAVQSKIYSYTPKRISTLLLKQ